MNTLTYQNKGSPLPEPTNTAAQMVERYKTVKKAHEVANFNCTKGAWQSESLIKFWREVSEILATMIQPKKPRAKRVSMSS